MIRQQQGSTLIVVLILLLAITIIGTLAIRQSMVSLNIATNSQAQQLMMQNSDAATFNIEDSSNLVRSLARDGMFGFIRGPENKGKELVFCIRGAVTDNFSGSRIASSVYWVGNSIMNTELGVNGFCKVERGDFISGRQAVMTQVSIRAADASRDWEHMMEGDDKESSKSTGIQKVAITATSILPNLGNASLKQVSGCLSNYTSFVDPLVKNETVTDCLSQLNVPYSTQDMEYSLRSLKAS